MAWHFGTDTGTSSGGACGQDFYIGKLGYGTTVSHDWTLASGSGIYAFPYWNIQGPADPARGSLTIVQWGQKQADAFTAAWGGKAPTGKTGSTMFGSIDTTGYTGTSITDNRNLVDAFLVQLDGENLVSVGLYGNTTEFANRLNSSTWTPPVGVVVWEAIFPYTGSGPACSVVERDFVRYATTKCGSYVTMIWQYGGTPTNPWDHDITPYNGGPDSGLWNPTT